MFVKYNTDIIIRTTNYLKENLLVNNVHMS